MKLNIPLMLTVARIILVPFLVLAIVHQQFTLAFQLLIVAGLTDLFDGMLARWLHQETELGARLDPVADKLLVMASYGALMTLDTPYFTIPGWFVALVVLRELCILAGAWYWSVQRHLVPVAPTMLGKITMALQLLLISFLVCSMLLECAFPHLTQLLLLLVATAVVASLVQYGVLVLQKVKHRV